MNRLDFNIKGEGELSISWLHDTVTSILVAGTLVLRGSNSPMEAIISTRDMMETSTVCLSSVGLNVVFVCSSSWSQTAAGLWR